MNIGILGAAFDPPHNGHRQIIQTLLSQKVFDEIWLVPTKHHAFAKKLTASTHRIAMIVRFLEDFSDLPVRIKTYEMDHPGVSFSYDTLDHFSMTHPDDTFAWIIGSDNVSSFPKWHMAAALLKRFPVYVYPRPGYPITTLLPGMIPMKNVLEIDLSSTFVRDRLSHHETILPFVSKSVADYIQTKSVYPASNSNK